jgi:hypothetical protein
MFFGPSKRTRYNAEWAAFRAAGRTVPAMPETLGTEEDVLLVQNAAQRCALHPFMRAYLAGPEVAGASVPIDDGRGLAENATPSDVLWHHGLVVLGSVMSAIGPRAYGGLFQMPSDSSLTFGIWAEYETWRLLVVPQLRLAVEQISFNISHVVLWRQGWMTEHGEDDFGWADLSTNYQKHLADGGTYWEVAASWKKGKRFWWKSRFGIGFDQSVGESLAVSEQFNSFYHFKVGDRCLRPGKPPGHDLGAAQQTIDGLVQRWGRLGQRMRSHPQRPPDARLHDLVRQKEE